MEKTNRRAGFPAERGIREKIKSSSLDLEIQTANIKMLGRQFDIQPRDQGTQVMEKVTHFEVTGMQMINILYLNKRSLGEVS